MRLKPFRFSHFNNVTAHSSQGALRISNDTCFLHKHIIVNANESNYNLPRPIEQAVAAKLAGFPFNRYPPMQAETLRGLIAEDLALDADNIRIGNGSSELLQMACYAFGGNGRKIAFPYPSFSMYGVYTKLADSIAAP